jgi:hypothetical protein
MKLRRVKPDRSSASEADQRGPDADAVPATPTQRDLYLDHARTPGDTTYSLALSVPLPSGVDPQAWCAAVDRTIAAAPALGRRFDLVGHDVVQLPALGPPEPTTHLRLPADTAAALEPHIKVAHDLGAGALVRHLLVDHPKGLRSVIMGHHIVLDAASGRHLFERAASVYADGAEPPTEAGLLSYARRAKLEFDTEEALGAWRSRLRPVAHLQASQRVRGDAAPAGDTAIDAATVADLAAARRATGASVPALLLVAAAAAAAGAGLVPDGDFVVYNVVCSRGNHHRGEVGCFYQVIPVVLPFVPAGEERLPHWLHAVRGYRRDLGPLQHISVAAQRRLVTGGGGRLVFNFYDFDRLHLLTQPVTMKVHDSFPEDEAHVIVHAAGDGLVVTLRDHGGWLDGARFQSRLEQALSTIRGYGA